ncbi:MaoC/PaaZ C-terminal domain-containing protein [soil metagenome]
MTPPHRPRLNDDLVGKRYEATVHEVTAEAIAAYARATNDLNERYLAGSRSVASPVWPVVPAFGSFMAVAKDPELRADLRRLLHAAEEHVLVRPLRAGDVVTVDSMLESIEERGTGQAFTIKSTERDPGGSVVAEVRGTMLIRGSGGASSTQERPRGDVLFEGETTVDPDQMQRYAEASGDRNPIHLDRRAARLAGLRSPILHGMCTMAMATKAAVDGPAAGDPARIGRVAVSFSRPVLPGQTLTTRLWELSSSGGTTTYGFETVDGAGHAVITDGEVDVHT